MRITMYNGEIIDLPGADEYVSEEDGKFLVFYDEEGDWLMSVVTKMIKTIAPIPPTQDYLQLS